MTTQVAQKTEMIPKRLSGKTALVTGGSRGIGAAIALRLAQEGATVAISYNNSPKKAEEVVAQITESGGKAFAFKGSVASEKETEKLVDDTVKKIGKIDILVNNAGVHEGLPIERIDLAHYDRLFDVNVKGLIATTIAALDKIKDGGRIINISSVAGRAPVPNNSVYAATKAAVNSLTRTWAQELGKRGITVNAVGPGATATDMYERVPQEMKDAMNAKTALGRVGEPEEIASVVAFLASEEGRWITGQIIYPDGGINI